MSPIRLLGRRLFATLITVVLSAGSSCAANVKPSSLSATDVQSAIDGCTNGDTVLLPAGTGIWGATVHVTKPITVTGAGMDRTVIVNVQSVDLQTLTGGEAFDVYARSNGVTRITGLTVNANLSGGAIRLDGDEFAPVRIDRCKIYHSRSEGIGVYGLVGGVIDHCTLMDNRLQIGCYPTTYMNDSWQRPLSLGSTNCLVVEDCSFLYQPGDVFNPWGNNFWISFEGGQGMREVLRYNRWTNYNESTSFYPIMDAHGNQAPVTNNYGTLRGTRQLEVYNNIFDNHVSASYSGACRLTHLRGGTILIYSNSFLGNRIDGTFYSQEEDGPSRFNWVSGYPGYDQHWMWFWNNRANTNAIQQLSFSDSPDAPFLLAGTNVFWSQPFSLTPPVTNYAPLPYPHPLVAAQDGLGASKNAVAAEATSDRTSGVVPLEVKFSSLGSFARQGVALTYFWTFGDGGTSTSVSPAHTYQTSGTYAAQLMVSDGVSSASSRCIAISVKP